MQQDAASPPQRKDPRGLVSLLEMLEMRSELFLAIMSAIGEFRELVVQYKDSLNRPFDPVAVPELNAMVAAFALNSKAIGARTSAMVADEIADAVARGTPRGEVFSLFGEYERALARDLAGVNLYRVESRHEHLLKPLDEEFALVLDVYFPAAIFHFEEARRCLAFELPTACVSHIGLAYEIALIELCSKFGLTPEVKESWGELLRRLRVVTDELDARRNTTKRWASADVQRRYHAAIKHTGTLKYAVRDPSAHGVYKFDMRRAEHEYDSAVLFMRELSELFGVAPTASAS